MMEIYPLVKHTHMSLAFLSLGLFMYRWVLAVRCSPKLSNTILKIAPHLIDTLLLGAGVWLMFIVQQFPGAALWLNIKLSLLITYIVLGSFALKRAKSPKSRMVFGIAAIIVFLGIVLTALNRHALY